MPLSLTTCPRNTNWSPWMRTKSDARAKTQLADTSAVQIIAVLILIAQPTNLDLFSKTFYTISRTRWLVSSFWPRFTRPLRQSERGSHHTLQWRKLNACLTNAKTRAQICKARIAPIGISPCETVVTTLHSVPPSQQQTSASPPKDWSNPAQF